MGYTSTLTCEERTIKYFLSRRLYNVMHLAKYADVERLRVRDYLEVKKIFIDARIAKRLAKG